MLWLFMLEDIFKRTIRPGFAGIFWCHCHLQYQISFGLGDGQDTEEFSNIGVFLGCCHYFYTKLCSRMTSGGDLYHARTSKLIRVANRWTGPCVMQFLLEGHSEIMLHHWCGNGKYTTVLPFGIGGGDARVPAPFHTLGCGQLLEHSQMSWIIARLGCVFHSGTGEITWCQEDTIAL